ncbi:MAG: HDOD domain-containing protein [Pseudomonadales bacterium]|nr:HDOD domain-containing protein [Pseudomonadales bacterium]
MMNIDIKTEIESMDQLPPSPLTVKKLSEMIANEDDIGGNEKSMSRIIATIEADSGLSGRLLSLSNSAFFGVSAKVNTLRQVVVFLGLIEIRNLAMCLTVMEMKNLQTAWQCLDAHEYWEETVSVACLTQILARELKAECAENFYDRGFTAGIMHNIGKIVLAELRPEAYKPLLELSKTERLAAEQQQFGVTSIEAAVCLLQSWQFPLDLIDAISCQTRFDVEQKPRFLGLSDLLYFGCRLYELIGSESEPDPAAVLAADAELAASLGHYGIDQKRLKKVLVHYGARITDARNFFGLDGAA